MDANGDGVVTLDEFKSAMRSMSLDRNTDWSLSSGSVGPSSPGGTPLGASPVGASPPGGGGGALYGPGPAGSSPGGEQRHHERHGARRLAQPQGPREQEPQGQGGPPSPLGQRARMSAPGAEEPGAGQPRPPAERVVSPFAAASSLP